MKKTHLTPELKSLVHHTVDILGQVIRRELGAKAYQRIEKIRQEMARLRGKNDQKSLEQLEKTFQLLKSLKSQEKIDIAHSFTLMLELMNICENAYRSYRLSTRAPWTDDKYKQKPDLIMYVLTAHPTESRSPASIAILHQVQSLLIQVLPRLAQNPDAVWDPAHEKALMHLLEVAWHTPLVRHRSPKVKDEAEHIYSILFRDNILFSLLDLVDGQVPFYVHTWVGGDKDGHPGVNEKTLYQSLSLSRREFIRIYQEQLEEIQETLQWMADKKILREVIAHKKQLRSLRTLKTGDGAMVLKLQSSLRALEKSYIKTLGAVHPSLRRLQQVIKVFPALVVPLELRESSDMLMLPPGRKKLAIEKMLDTVARLSKGAEPRWYARGFIISMAESLEHIHAAGKKQKAAFGAMRLPIIPLFEEASSLKNSAQIMTEVTQDAQLTKAARQYWSNVLEMMVGYSDSSKESGVLASRLAIAEAMPRLEKVCRQNKFIPQFFHGSGGSVDRGGGSVQDQTAWWPEAALRRYKVTVQGEIVERSLATADIARGQVEHIIDSASQGLSQRRHFAKSPALDIFAKKIAESYHIQVTSPDFLTMVEKATPYSYLRYLKIGSRPVKRSATLTVAGLRAIPWVMCWTQTRVLFPTWWGVGSAWSTMTPKEKAEIKQDFHREPVFNSYVKALGFTLAKLELPIWRMYLEKSAMPEAAIEKHFYSFKEELEKTWTFFRAVTGEKDPTWYRPWLGESIHLRSPMIHPLNLLQILAEKEKNVELLRISVTGISSGMMTTG